MSRRRFGDYPSRSSARDREETDENRRSYSGRVSRYSRPEREARVEYDTRRYHDGGRDRQPLKLSGLSADLPVSQSTSMKFQWNHLLAQKPDGSNPTLNPGLNRPGFGFGNDSSSYRLNAENGYAGGSGKSGVPDPGVDPSRKYGYFHGGLTSPLAKSHVGVPKVDDFRHGDHRQYMGQEDKTVFGSGPGCSSGLKEGFRGLSDQFNRSREMAAEGRIDIGGYSSQGQAPRLNELLDSNWAQHSPNGDYNAPGVKRSDHGEMGTFPIRDLLCKNLANSVGEDTRPPSYLRPSVVDSIMGRIDGANGALRVGTQEISQWNQYHNFTEQTQPTIPSYQSLGTKQSLPDYSEALGSSSRTRDFGFGGDDALERGLEALSYEGALKRLARLEGDPGLDDVTTLEMCAMRKRALAKRRRGNDSKSELFHDFSDSCNVPDLSYGDNQLTNDDVEQYATIGEGQWNIDQAPNLGEDRLNINQNMNFGDYQPSIARDVTCEEDQWNIEQDVSYREAQWNAEDINELNSDNVLPSSKMQEHQGEQFKSARVDIKKRLGPLTSSGSIRKRLEPLNTPGSVKKRLGPLKSPGSVKKRLAPAQNVPDPKYLGHKLEDQYKSRIRETDDFSGSIHPQGGGLPKVEGKPTKKALPEDSEEFKRLVDSAFLKYMKGLHENPALKRKFMEGGTVTTKCCICASNSKEFAGTVPLATHAFMSPMVGSRAEHLGFHKALCVLLGWDSAAVSNGTWIQRCLPDAEALALKEDVVIWPPVVVIHNSSIANKKPDERVIVSIEGLGAILKGIGFGGGKTKVCRGKPANQSILVVTFNATFSGLREAERLHKLFAENKHGRVEFHKISSAGLRNSSNGKQELLADEANCLYGYLGIAEDLDKLETETKKRCVVKSKREIQAIACNSLRNE
ncbi:hypothetical protein PRUPE_6G121100 [Prunus persica]|uniref:XS domain-containing protein n=1 Tax=Prunus persica TaxID=3760 RepID=A0A251NP54_PRUPE|nr:uncharacterized protein LOC18772944 [Prunus persica]ONI01094.1 hypothetical protein PRUPE_6G121100 [Prunus persica]